MTGRVVSFMGAVLNGMIKQVLSNTNDSSFDCADLCVVGQAVFEAALSRLDHGLVELCLSCIGALADRGVIPHTKHQALSDMVRHFEMASVALKAIDSLTSHRLHMQAVTYLSVLAAVGMVFLDRCLQLVLDDEVLRRNNMAQRLHGSLQTEMPDFLTASDLGLVLSRAHLKPGTVLSYVWPLYLQTLAGRTAPVTQVRAAMRVMMDVKFIYSVGGQANAFPL